MEFTTRKDIEAPQQYVFVAASDFAVFERQALRRNVDITRTEGPGPAREGTAWRIRFDYRGRSREIDARVVSFEAPGGYVIKGSTAGLDIVLKLELMPLSKATTRMFMSLELLPTTMTARLLVQSLKLAKSSMSRKLDNRAATFASDIEDRYRAEV